MVCRTFIVALLVPLFFVLSCGKKTSTQQETNSEQKAISNRLPKKAVHSVLMIKLRTNALLANSKFVNNKLEIDQDQKIQVLKEQEELIKSLEELSDEIRILYKYRFVLNAISAVIPADLVEQVHALPHVLAVQSNLPFERPKADKIAKNVPPIGLYTSVGFIGAEKVRRELTVKDASGKEVPLDGRGIKIGVIDSGIDYTHKMFLGEGTEEAYAKVNPDNLDGGQFPNAKVVGGIDLVGGDYNEGGSNVDNKIPKPGKNPIDEEGHGSHVAGTIAGIGDGINTYSGVAPGAQLYAIKVFGRDGSTSDTVVIAGLEYAVDPNGDLNPDDKLDVVNLSLGSSYGLPHALYDEAISNLVKARITPVTSAGNSGGSPYIVGTPSVSTDSISVAAVVDNMEHNWKFRAVEFDLEQGEKSEKILAKAIEGGTTKPLKELSGIKARLVFLGFAEVDFSVEEKAQVDGKIALIDRGKSSFGDKIKRAQDAGAIGVIIVDDQDKEENIVMHSDEEYKIPGIILSKKTGAIIKKHLEKKLSVVADMTTDKMVETPHAIDTLTSFTSRGPRSIDSLIKPEIATPGYNIISADFGSGSKAAMKSGTSMASPHMTGAVALLKQKYPNITEEEVKSFFFSTAKTLMDKNDHEKPYSIAYQGTGRAQVYEALTTPLLITPAALSLGEVQVLSHKVVRKIVKMKNLGSEPITVTVHQKTSPGISFKFNENRKADISEISFKPNETKDIEVLVLLDASVSKNPVEELSGFAEFLDVDHKFKVKLSALAVTKRTSIVKSKVFKVHSGSEDDGTGSLSELTLENYGSSEGKALLFNLIATDDRKEGLGIDHRYNDNCDLESAGYRIITVENKNGQDVKLLQIATKLFSPLTTWHHCETSIQIQGEKKNKFPTQELLGTDLHSLSNKFKKGSFFSVLTDAHKMLQIRKEKVNKPDSKSSLKKKSIEDGESVDASKNTKGRDYSPAFLDLRNLDSYDHSTIQVVSMPLKSLALTKEGKLRIKVASLVASHVIGTRDDFLDDEEDNWREIDPNEEASPYYGMPGEVVLQPRTAATVHFTKGSAKGKLVAYYPYNRSTFLVTEEDKQQQILTPEFAY